MPLLGTTALCCLAALPLLGDPPPVLYATPHYEAPVAGGARDLLFLAGAGLTTRSEVYARGADGLQRRLELASVLDSPDALVARLPAEMAADAVLSVSVRSASGASSAETRINDRRPLWFSPAQMFSSQRTANLPRELRIVGRNLQPQSGGRDRLRLSGPATIEIDLGPPPPDDRAFSRHVAVATLPTTLAPGRYALALLRAGDAPVEVPGAFEVLPDAVAPPVFRVGAEGCAPDDGADDTACLARALERARSVRGVVAFDAGTWDLAASTTPGGTLMLPPGVGLRGATAASTRLRRHAGWRGGTREPTFTLLGGNRVEGIGFADLRRHQVGDAKSPMLRLGLFDDGRQDLPEASDLVVTRCAFEQTHPAIADGGVPLTRVAITYNVFGAWSEALELSGNRYNLRRPFRLDASIIRYNLFAPGSYLDRAARQGAIATEIGASDRLDFSDNVADGASTAYLREPGDASGWRAAFFWHMNNSHERLLVARNDIRCPGDKIGDGEAIAFDNNANSFALREPAVVHGAGTGFVEIAAPLAGTQQGRAVAVERYYRGHWIQVVQGPGLGQSRRIRAYARDGLGRTRFEVDPPWDVVPVASRSQLLIGRLFWQALVLDNRIDQRAPLCRKSNRSNARGGQIALWAPTSASTVQGNVQYDSDGIVYQQSYTAADQACASCTAQSFTQYFLDIRGNRVEGEYDWDSDCSASGIQGSHSAAQAGAPPTLGFGINLAHNLVRRADGLRGGGIALPLTWHAGPAPQDWPLVRGTLVHHNRVEEIEGPGPRRDCAAADGQSRAGIVLSPARLLRNIVVEANACERTPVGLRDGAAQATLRCSGAEAVGACGCGASPR